MKMRFAICGLGFAGSVLMAPAMRKHPDAEIVAAADPNEDVRVRFGKDFGVPVFAGLEQMLDGIEADAVYVASPHQFHCDHVLLAASRGLHVIVEKPLTLGLDEANRIVEAVDRAGVKLVVGHSRSHDPVIRTMRNAILGGELGRLAMIHCWNYTDFLYRPRRPEELDTSKGGGIVFNQLPHQIDSIKTLANERVVAVKAGAGMLDPKRPTEGHCAAFLTLESGAFATLVYSGYDHFDSDELQFWIAEGGRPKKPNHGNARRILAGLASGDEPRLRTERYGYGGPISQGFAAGELDRKQPHFGVMIATCERGDLRPGPDGVFVYGDEGVRELPAQTGRGSFGQGDTIDELVDAVRGTAPVLRDARWGRNTLAVCLAVLESARTGREVAVREA